MPGTVPPFRGRGGYAERYCAPRLPSFPGAPLDYSGNSCLPELARPPI